MKDGNLGIFILVFTAAVGMENVKMYIFRFIGFFI